MKLEERIMVDLKTAMKSKDQAALRGVRAVKAALLLAKTDGSGTILDESGEIKLLQKLVKQRQDSLDIFTKQGRDDLAKIEEEEIAVIQKYLPEQLDPKALQSLISEIIQQSGASSMKDMGRVMGMANQKLAGKADGKSIAAIVKELLSN